MRVPLPHFDHFVCFRFTSRTRGVPLPYFGHCLLAGLGEFQSLTVIILCASGLLAGLWEFPSLTLDSECHEVTDYTTVLGKYGLQVNEVSRTVTAGEVS